MANYLLLNAPQVFVGLGTLSYTIPSTGQYNVRFSASLPYAPAVNASPGGAGVAVGVGGTFGAGSGMGLGAGTGGGGQGFTKGDQGAGSGNPGQGFGAGNSYQQPPAAGPNQTSNSPIQSALSVVVNVNGSPVYTSTAPTGLQSALQFQYGFQASATDAITVVLTGTAGLDDALNTVQSITSINQGLL